MRSPLVPVVALVLASVALGCQSHNDISTAKGVPTRPTNSSTGLGNVGGGNDRPDADHVADPDSGLVTWSDAGAPDGLLPNQEGQCAGETQAAQQVPLDLLL